MCDYIKIKCTLSLLLCVALNCNASNDWKEKEVEMQCGSATVNIRAECKADPEDQDANVCRNVTMNISHAGKLFSTAIPYMPIEQKKKLENQRFTFPSVIDSSNWAPQKMYCLSKQYIVIGYWDGMNDAETIDGSLSAGTAAPIFDFNGDFVDEKKSTELRKEINSSHDATYIDFVYGNE